MRQKNICVALVLLVCFNAADAQVRYNDSIAKAMISFNREMKSDRLIFSIADSVIVNETFSGDPSDKFRIYSITKIFAGIAVGIMVDKGMIPHAEIPIARFFQELQADPLKSRVTIRHILQHTSGISAGKGGKELEGQNDLVQAALNSPVITEPGSTFFYNNKAVNIISGIVRKVTGKSLEAFVREHVFEPMGIRDYKWMSDGAGNSLVMDGLWISAGDLMKVAQMLANKGEWHSRRILSEQWCSLMFQMPLVNAMHGKYGYAMCIRALPTSEKVVIRSETIDLLDKQGLDKALVNKLRSLGAKEYYRYMELGEQLKVLFTDGEMETISALCSSNNIPVYAILNQSYFVMHGGEYGLLLAAIPAQRKAMVRFLGEKWGRKTKPDGSYKYFIDDELLGYMIRM